MGEDEDEEDAELDDECAIFSSCSEHILTSCRYSDDEDTSYKIRRAATKLHSAIIGTRPELLVSLYRDVSPVLISRFGDREETVRLEIWATYAVLLNQTRVYGGNAQAGGGIGYKRKRTPDGMDLEETAHALLQSQVPALSKSLLNQMKSHRTPPAVLQSGFGLLSTLLDVLPGCLASQAAPILTISKSVLSQAATSNSTLHISCLQFLFSFFSTHLPHAYASQLSTITPVLLITLSERHPRIASESFRAFSALLNSMKPVKGQDWVESVYQEALKRLANHDTDAEVRSRAEEVIGDLWVCATDVVKAKDEREWTFICRSTGRIDGAIKVVSRVAQEVDVATPWVNGCVEWAVTMLKKAGRAGKVEMFECLSTLLAQ
jgi:cullin-associated NEDD8-dissociated protein 1